MGGLGEKIVAARRHGISRVLVPKGNEKDLVEIHKEARRGLQIIPVSTMDDVLGHAMTRPVLKELPAAGAEAVAEPGTPASVPVSVPVTPPLEPPLEPPPVAH